jgi:hypothetical protein
VRDAERMAVSLSPTQVLWPRSRHCRDEEASSSVSALLVSMLHLLRLSTFKPGALTPQQSNKERSRSMHALLVRLMDVVCEPFKAAQHCSGP